MVVGIYRGSLSIFGKNSRFFLLIVVRILFLESKFLGTSKRKGKQIYGQQTCD